MISLTTRDFWHAYEKLSEAHQAAARRAFRLFMLDPGHNSLRFKKLGGHRDYWSVRVSLDIRVVGRRQGDTVEWAWIGSHQEFDQRFG